MRTCLLAKPEKRLNHDVGRSRSRWWRSASLSILKLQTSTTVQRSTARIMARKSLLPGHFVKEILAKPTFSIDSQILQPDFHDLRTKMVGGTNPNHPDLSADHIPAYTNNMAESNKLTLLHIGAMGSDPLLVCEMIRIGATIDFPNAHGATALWLAAGAFGKASKMHWAPSEDPRKRLAFIIQTLVEQRANVNITHHGVTPLHFMCLAAEWDLIRLLLAHGAHPNSIPVARLFPKQQDQKRFQTLASNHAGKSRPARPCPCWSGKLLADCHNAGQIPYPHEYVCRCGSGKAHGKCCAKRKGMSQTSR